MESLENGDGIKLCSRSSQTTLCFVKKAVFSIVWHTKNVQRYWHGLVHEFCGLKASQMSKVHASSHEYPHVEKIMNLCEQNNFQK